MAKTILLLVTLTVLLVNIQMIYSLECYLCESKEKSEPNKYCENASTFHLAKETCKTESDQEVPVCFKINGTGTNSREQTIIRGCYNQLIKPYRRFTPEDPFKYTNPTTKKEFNVDGLLYTCDSSLCNSSTNLKYPLVLLASLAGLSTFFNFKPK